MKILWTSLIAFWIIIILFPAILVFLIWWFFIFVWVNIIASSIYLNKTAKNQEEYIKFGKYKIYR